MHRLPWWFCLVVSAVSAQSATVGFAETSYTVPEGGSVEVCVRVISPDGDLGGYMGFVEIIPSDSAPPPSTFHGLNEATKDGIEELFGEYLMLPGADYPQPLGGSEHQIRGRPLKQTRRTVCYTQPTYDDAVSEGDEYFSLKLHKYSRPLRTILHPMFNTTHIRIVDDDVFCSEESDCSGEVTSCCRTSGTYTYHVSNQCQLCFEYGWVQEISEDRQSALPLYEVNATEGESIDLNIFFLQNGPSSRDFYTFTIATGGSAMNYTDYSVVYDGVLRLTNAPLPLQVVTVDDGVYEGTETIYLTLAQKDSSNNVTNGMGLTSETLSITLKDNDKVNIGFSEQYMTLWKNAGNITVTVNIIGKTVVPITVDLVFSGSAEYAQDYTVAEPHALRFNSSGTEWFVLTIVDDREIENTEIINIALANPQPPDAVLELGTASITIIPLSVFEQARYTVAEDDGSIDVCVHVLSGTVFDQFTLNIDLLPSTASDDDFQFSSDPPTINIVPGTSRGCLTIYILSSAVVEHDEEIHLTIAGTSETTTVVIEDNGVVVLEFGVESYTASENSVVELAVLKSAPCDFDIHFRVYTDGLFQREMVFTATDSSITVSVEIPDNDVALEPDGTRVVTLSLVVPDPQVDIDSNFATLTILDDDTTVTVGFDKGRTTTVPEGGGRVEVSVSLSHEVAVPVAVDVVVFNGSAIENQDFEVTGPSSTLTFVDERTQWYSVNIIDDEEHEEMESFTLSLINAHPTSVMVHQDKITVTITDNDGGVISWIVSNYHLLIPAVSVIVITVVIVAIAIFCCRRRRQRKLKSSSLQCSNPLNDQNHYQLSSIMNRKGENPQLGRNDEANKDKVVKVVVPTPHTEQSNRKYSVNISRNSQTVGENTMCVAPETEVENDECVLPQAPCDLHEVDVEPNVAYGYLQTPSSPEYENPQRLFGQHIRPRPLSEVQSVEAYAVTTLT